MVLIVFLMTVGAEWGAVFGDGLFGLCWEQLMCPFEGEQEAMRESSEASLVVWHVDLMKDLVRPVIDVLYL